MNSLLQTSVMSFSSGVSHSHKCNTRHLERYQTPSFTHSLISVSAFTLSFLNGSDLSPQNILLQQVVLEHNLLLQIFFSHSFINSCHSQTVSIYFQDRPAPPAPSKTFHPSDQCRGLTEKILRKTFSGLLHLSSGPLEGLWWERNIMKKT